jgi:hypothetical protein
MHRVCDFVDPHLPCLCLSVAMDEKHVAWEQPYRFFETIGQAAGRSSEVAKVGFL